MAVNPIRFTEQVVEDFLSYTASTYPFAHPSLHAQLRALLSMQDSRATPLRQGPFVSISRPFAQGETLAGLAARGLLHPGVPPRMEHGTLRAHQQEAIESILQGHTTLVATGTGSGKTEAFVIPMLHRALEVNAAGAPPGIIAVAEALSHEAGRAVSAEGHRRASSRWPKR